MAGLKEFLKFLTERQAVLAGVEAKLCQLQEKYENFFQEVSRVREHEFGQLSEHILGDRDSLPTELRQSLEAAEATEQEAFEKKLAEVEYSRQSLQAQAEEARRQSSELEGVMRQENVALDTQEEELKERSTHLLKEIADYNGRIRELGHGFGFLANFFSMRGLQHKRRELEQAQDDVAARIEKHRATWAEESSGWKDTEQSLRGRWLELQTQAAAVQTKLEYLQSARTRVVLRSALERVLFAHLDRSGPADAPATRCPRCHQDNPPDHRFCHICALRLADDRPDLSGSLQEIAELNMHHQRFSEGMRACQEIIGLVRGLKTGHDNFAESVSDMISNEKRYASLCTLRINVPGAARTYGRVFDRLREMVGSGASDHPHTFAKRIRGLVGDELTEPNVKAYFELMGDELSRQAKAQW